MLTSANQNRAVFDGRGITKVVPLKPPAKDGSVTYEFKGFKVQILGKLGDYVAFIQKEDGSPFLVTHSNGDHFTHRPSVRTSVKTIIKWHLKFGDWRIPKSNKTAKNSPTGGAQNTPASCTKSTKHPGQETSSDRVFDFRCGCMPLDRKKTKA